MKLESYEMAAALASGKIDTAVRQLLDYFRLPQPNILPKHTVLPAQGEVRLLIWTGDYFYEWSSATGFDHGCHNYPLEPDNQQRKLDSIILWI